MELSLLGLLLSLLAVFIVGISKGGFGGGLGMLAVPLMSLAISPVLAAAILLPVLCAMDLMALRAYWGKWSLLHARRLIPAAIIGILLGAFSFSYFNANHVKLMIGLIAVGFALNHWLQPAKRWLKQKPGAIAGILWGGMAGFTSFVSHSGGPPMSVYLLPQQLEKSTHQATTVLFFTVVNYVKLIPYALLGQLNLSNLTNSLWLLPVAAGGVWTGVYLHKRISDRLFFQLTYLLLFSTGLKLIYDGVSHF